MDISVMKNLGKWMKVRMNIENAQNNQKLSCAFKLVRNGNSKEKCCYSNSKNRDFEEGSQNTSFISYYTIHEDPTIGNQMKICPIRIYIHPIRSFTVIMKAFII